MMRVLVTHMGAISSMQLSHWAFALDPLCCKLSLPLAFVIIGETDMNSPVRNYKRLKRM